MIKKKNTEVLTCVYTELVLDVCLVVFLINPHGGSIASSDAVLSDETRHTKDLMSCTITHLGLFAKPQIQNNNIKVLK